LSSFSSVVITRLVRTALGRVIQYRDVKDHFEGRGVLDAPPSRA
jgi:hypothetical protein